MMHMWDLSLFEVLYKILKSALSCLGLKSSRINDLPTNYFKRKPISRTGFMKTYTQLISGKDVQDQLVICRCLIYVYSKKSFTCVTKNNINHVATYIILYA